MREHLHLTPGVHSQIRQPVLNILTLGEIPNAVQAFIAL